MISSFFWCLLRLKREKHHELPEGFRVETLCRRRHVKVMGGWGVIFLGLNITRIYYLFDPQRIESTRNAERSPGSEERCSASCFYNIVSFGSHRHRFPVAAFFSQKSSFLLVPKVRHGSRVCAGEEAVYGYTL